jgi:hypothetical protein
MKVKILPLVVAALTAGVMWGFSQQPLDQTAQAYPNVSMEKRVGSGLHQLRFYTHGYK